MNAPTFTELRDSGNHTAALSLLTAEYADLIDTLKTADDYEAHFVHIGGGRQGDYALLIDTISIDHTLTVQAWITNGHGTITPDTDLFTVELRDHADGTEVADGVSENVHDAIAKALDELVIAPSTRSIFWKTTMTEGILLEGEHCAFDVRFDAEKSTQKPVDPDAVRKIEGVFWKVERNDDREWYLYLKDGSIDGMPQPHQGFPVADLVGGITVQMIADVMKRQITDDIRDGVVPEDVTTFSQLHDHVDANMYGDDVQLARERSTGQNWLDYINEATDIVDAWLRAGRK